MTDSTMTDRDRTRVDEPRSDSTPEWEVFLREDESEPLRHVGSVSAPDEAAARERAAALFGRTARTLWLCRADDVARFSERDLGSAAASRPDATSSGTETAERATPASATEGGEDG